MGDGGTCATGGKRRLPALPSAYGDSRTTRSSQAPQAIVSPPRSYPWQPTADTSATLHLDTRLTLHVCLIDAVLVRCFSAFVTCWCMYYFSTRHPFSTPKLYATAHTLLIADCYSRVNGLECALRQTCYWRVSGVLGIQSRQAGDMVLERCLSWNRRRWRGVCSRQIEARLQVGNALPCYVSWSLPGLA